MPVNRVVSQKRISKRLCGTSLFVWLKLSLPRAGRYVQDFVIFGQEVFFPVLNYTHYTLLDSEVFVLQTMYMSARTS